jgi:hypothetical protein
MPVMCPNYQCTNTFVRATNENHSSSPYSLLILRLAVSLWLPIANLPHPIPIPDDQTLVEEIPFEEFVEPPICRFERHHVAILLQVPTDMLHAFLPAIDAAEVTIAEQAGCLLWRLSKCLVAALVMLCEIIIGDRIMVGLLARESRLNRRWSMHAAEVLREKILAVEVVVVYGSIISRVCSSRTEVASPVTQLDMLSSNMPLPLVLRQEVGLAPIGGKRAWEWSFITVPIGRHVWDFD